MGWTVPTTRATGELITAVEWNTDLVENLKALRDLPAAQIYYSSGSLSVPTGSSAYRIPLATVLYDTDGITTPTANVLTIRTAGVYLVTGWVIWTTNALSAASWVWATSSIRLNGSNMIADSRLIGGTSLGTPPAPINVPLALETKLAANDVVDLCALHSYGFAINLSAGSPYAMRLCVSFQGEG
jgi:hypothetical protein